MIADLVTTALVILAGILVVRFWPALSGAARRFDASTRARRDAELQDRRDANAHFRHTLSLAEEQVDAIARVTVADARTGQPVPHFLFEGESFLDEAEARRVREDKVRAIARRFYVDLPAALSARKEDDRLGR